MVANTDVTIVTTFSKRQHGTEKAFGLVTQLPVVRISVLLSGRDATAPLGISMLGTSFSFLGSIKFQLG